MFSQRKRGKLVETFASGGSRLTAKSVHQKPQFSSWLVMGREIEEVLVPWGAPTFFYREGVPLCFLVQRAGGGDGRGRRVRRGYPEPALQGTSVWAWPQCHPLGPGQDVACELRVSAFL